MKSVRIHLNGSTENVKAFVNKMLGYNFDIDLVSNRYVIDAKSLMGIFSLDLSKAIEMQIHSDDPKADELLEAINEFVIPEAE